MSERNITISGAGRIAGGSYGRVKIAGAAKVAGNLEAEEFKSAGSARIEGTLVARRFESAGAFKCMGNLETDEGEGAGSFKVEGKIKAKELKLAGATHAKAIAGGYLRIGGSLEVEEDVEVDTFRITGGFQIGGLLSADKVEIQLEGACRAREIGGERIEIKRSTRTIGGLLTNTLGFLFRHDKVKELHTETIEGDDIYIEATMAKVVRGARIRIGPGCRVDRVEYSASLDVDPQSTVGEEVKG